MTIEILENEFVNANIPLTEKMELIHEYQVNESTIYKEYCNLINPDIAFPFPAPISIDLFKIPNWSSGYEAELVFKSSATGGWRSVHPVRKASIYKRSIEAAFSIVFGEGPFTIASHLPGYIESGEESSLLYMVRHLIERFGNSSSGGFFGEPEKLKKMTKKSLDSEHPLIVFGAAFGLLDFVEKSPVNLPQNSIVIETGGMKTYRQEIGRELLHQRLSSGFGINRKQVYSEYGMCELLSQCYSRGGVTFHAPPWMKVSIVDPEAPWVLLPEGGVGAISVFDCANMYSISSILTGDLGRKLDGGFEVLGRLQNSELRGCNFLIEDLLHES